MKPAALLLFLVLAFLSGCQAGPIPPNRLDPEDPRAQNASGGASSPQAAPEAGDVGKEADKEDELYRKLHKP